LTKKGRAVATLALAGRSREIFKLREGLDEDRQVSLFAAPNASEVCAAATHRLSPLVAEPKQAEPLARLHYGRIMRAATPLLQRLAID
jgi:hypothetical protein